MRFYFLLIAAFIAAMYMLGVEYHQLLQWLLSPTKRVICYSLCEFVLLTSSSTQKQILRGGRLNKKRKGKDVPTLDQKDLVIVGYIALYATKDGLKRPVAVAVRQAGGKYLHGYVDCYCEQTAATSTADHKLRTAPPRHIPDNLVIGGSLDRRMEEPDHRGRRPYRNWKSRRRHPWWRGVLKHGVTGQNLGHLSLR